MYDVSIIGAGVVGSAIARELSKYDLKVALVEKESDVSTGASKANTGVVHGGYVGKAGTLKGELCIKGNELYQDLNDKLHFGYKKTGGVVLAFDDEDEKTLEKLYENALKVGQSEDDIEIIYGDQIKEIEPHVSDEAQAAFYCKSIGVTSPFEMTIALAENAVDNGVELKLESEVLNIEKKKEYFEIETEKEKIETRYIVNAAGIYADKIAAMVDAADFEIYPMRGEYVVFSKEQGHLVNTVIFQAPNPKTKGVVATTTTHGNFMIGPNAEEIDKKEDVGTTLKEFHYIIEQSRKSIPDFDTDKMLRTFAGLRPKSTRGDFIIEESSVKGFIQAAGIDSPGLTSSPAIAKKILNILEKSGLELKAKSDFNPNRPAIAREKGEGFSGEIDHENPDKNIICRCENVTEAEILDALSRSIPIKTTDAVKRRTRAKTGECQANFCESRIKEILSRELNIPTDQVKNRDEDNVPKRLDVNEIRQMPMFCFQCQEAGGGTGCVAKGVCGKEESTANLQDLLIYLLKGIAIYLKQAKERGVDTEEADYFIVDSLFSTISNANFDNQSFMNKIGKALAIRKDIRKKAERAGAVFSSDIDDAAIWKPADDEELKQKAKKVGVLATKNKDIRSLREMITYGLKGMAAYTEHAYNLGYQDPDIFKFIAYTLVKLTDDSLSIDELFELTMTTGDYGLKAMALLDQANTESYGNPEITEVEIGVSDNPGILISGHDLKDMEMLLEQTKDSGVDIYTHSEMLPANYYPAFKKYDHFIGNYGSSWWRQREEFETFHGPILFTTNCIVPPWPAASYQNKIFTTNSTGYPGSMHIEADENGYKDFSPVIEAAKNSQVPEEIETGKIIGGFAHNQVVELADKMVDAVEKGKIKKFFVMAGCDGRFKERRYYTEFAEKLPKDTVILTAGCAKYRYNKLDLGDIDGIPRVLDAGQCNDSYSLIMIAQKLAEIFEVEDVNDLPIAYNIAWYEQKAVIIFLALLSLGIKNIKLGPTLPAFLSENVAETIINKFDLTTIGEVEADIAEFLS